MSTPFLIFSWDKPFLPDLVWSLYETSGGDIGQSVIIVPHNRPRRYITELFCRHPQIPRPTLLPRIITMTELVELLRPTDATAPLHPAQPLDRVALLHQCVRDEVDATSVNKDDFAPYRRDLYRHFSAMDMETFLPWGMRLAALLEECFTQNIDARNLLYTDDEVAPTAAALLAVLGSLQQRYTDLLHAGNWTTPGLDARLAARAAATAPLPACLQRGTVFIAGFSALSHTENAILHRLWRHGAHVCLHTDARVAGHKSEAHWACSDHQKWIRDWKAQTVLAAPPSGNTPRMEFTAGFDVHSQLLGMRDLLRHPAAPAVHTDDADTADAQTTTAIVLANDALLMPVLHHLPQEDFNVSMGYPLERAPLSRLLESILRLYDAAPQGGAPAPDASTRCHWRLLLHCLRHPYWRMLRADAQDTDGPGGLLFKLEQALRTGARFVFPRALLETLWQSTAVPPAQRALLEEIFAVIAGFGEARTPHALGDALYALCTCLRTRGDAIWQRCPTDAESLYRLVQHVVPQLQNSALAEESFSQSTLSALLRQLLHAERVPFEADPLTALQVLGMLETRLLHFDRLIILDTNDDALPGFSAQDPLLPDALRPLLGLPDAHRRERITAHNLFRLVAGAREVHFYWQEGIQHSGLLDGKKNRSRFVEECLWRVEQERGELLEAGVAPLHTVNCTVQPLQQTLTPPRMTDALRARIRALLTSGISPTHLDNYMQCPARFAWANAYGFNIVKEVNEGDKLDEIGKLLHAVLQDAYAGFTNQTVSTEFSPTRTDTAAVLTLQRLTDLFAAHIAASPLQTELPPDNFLMLQASVPRRLKSFLQHQPASTFIIDVERKMQAAFAGTGFVLRGILDRIDKRDDALVVLDYKTGSAHTPAKGAWSDDALWDDIELWDGTENHDLLRRVAESFPSVQLHCYLYMCAQNPLGLPMRDAVWVPLGKDGKEVPLISPKTPAEDRTCILQRQIPQLLDFVLRHIAADASFTPNKGTHCRWCDYAGLCRT